MLQFMSRRLVVVIATFIGVTFFAFSLIHIIPGDPVLVMLGERGCSADHHAKMMAKLGLDRPLWEQLWK
ncbi:MAG: peptide ABC transporter permease [Candidatus Liberibacter europaeus]|uniref:Peptide ABC transporter permease n=1 Tax=Candidatus Liberibacter europaeus TaxID=744859 RepID=A0A2T4VXG6_9HYPH|nr:peptide ABC transporter permease [Candidatus Liberibacter europaeus]PTL86460.1 MAG: peptide ABC transporter permease [Candidatus Liberibacter europaeus]